jgi:hypothetical protein
MAEVCTVCRTIHILLDLWAWYPGVGWYIAFLGFLGVAVTILRDVTKISRREKVVWIVITFALLLLELHSITLDRKAHDREQSDARSEQLNQFGKIAEGINATIAANQQHFDATMGSMKSLLETTRETKKNTEPRAYVKLSAFGLRPSSLPMAVDHQLQLNVFLENAGNENATELVTDSKMYLGRPNDPGEEARLSGDFERWWEHPDHRHWVYKVYAPGDKSHFFTINAPSLTADDLRDIQKNAVTFYTLSRFVYSDHSGRWVHDECSWMQNPTDFSVTRPCSVNNNPRHRAKRPWSIEWNHKLR